MLALLFVLAMQVAGVGVVAIVLLLAWRFVRAQEGRARIAGGGGGEALTHRIAELEEAVGRIDSELARLDEGQRFMTRLLTERRETTPASGNEIQ